MVAWMVAVELKTGLRAAEDFGGTIAMANVAQTINCLHSLLWRKMTGLCVRRPTMFSRCGASAVFTDACEPRRGERVQLRMHICLDPYPAKDFLRVPVNGESGQGHFGIAMMIEHDHRPPNHSEYGSSGSSPSGRKTGYQEK